jgi:hypothetical protein
MSARTCGIGVAIGVAALWMLGGTQHSGSVLSGQTESTRVLEARAAAQPGNPEAIRRLAQAYLDAGQPGLARVLLGAAPDSVQADVRAKHVLARALLEEGRSDLALDLETRVIAACHPSESAGLAPSCDPVLYASAVRRAGILREVVAMGVRDVLQHPEASLIAYENATREARIRLE